jgi:hypothetical protein
LYVYQRVCWDAVEMPLALYGEIERHD